MRAKIIRLLIFAVTARFFIVPIPSVAEGKIKIGVSTPLSGAGASWGTDLKNSVLFANKVLTSGAYEIILEDDKCAGKDAVTVAHKLVENKIRAVFGNCSGTVLSSAPIYAKRNIVVFAPIATSSKISEITPHIVRTVPSDAASARFLFDHIAKQHRTIGVLTEQVDYPIDFARDFNGANRGSAVTVRSEEFLSNDADVRSAILKMRQTNIDALFINANSESSFVNVLKQFRQLGGKQPIYGAIIPGSATFLKLAGKDAEGIEFVDYPQGSSVLNEEGRKLYQQFVAEFGPPQAWDITFASTFESFRVMHEMLQAGGDPWQTIAGRKFHGIFGDYEFNKEGDIVGLQPALRKITHGQALPFVD